MAMKETMRFVRYTMLEGSVSGSSGNDEVFGKGYYVNGDEGDDYLSLDSALDLKGEAREMMF